MNDIRYALRMLARSPLFTAVAVLTVALGIGANTAIFSVVNSVLLAPLGYRDAGRIVAVGTRWRDTGHEVPRVAGGDLVDLRASNRAFDALGTYFGGVVGVQLRDRAEFTGTYWVDADFFRVFGLAPAAGRLFGETDAGRSAVVSLPFAARMFGSGAAAVGRTLSVENRTYEITGVAPAGFEFPRQAEIWAAAPAKLGNLNRTAYNYRVVAKLTAGITLEQARVQLDTLGARLAADHPDSNRNKTFAATPLRDQLVGPVRATLWVLMGAVSLVLLIACANVANLLLARVPSRSREMAVRAALGAGRARILRQLAVESAVLALIGGVLGLLLARAGIGALLRLAPENLPRLNEVRVDRLVLAFAGVVSLAASLLFGLAPAWQASRADLNEALKHGGARGLLGGGSNRLRSLLVVAEIALSFVLAIGAGLLFRSFLALLNAPLGYRTEGVLVMYAHAPARTLEEHLGVGRFFERLLPDLAAIPGVKSVGSAMGLPTGPYSSDGSYAVEGKHRFAPGEHLPHAGFRLAGPGYFATMGIPLRRGRDFSERDQYDAPFVAIVSEALARQTFPNEDPIGHRVQCGLDAPGRWMTIVGVAGDVRQESPASPPAPELYMPLAQHPYYANEVQIVLRTAVAPGSLVGAAREKVRQRDPAVAMRFTTMEEMVAASIGTPHFRTLLVGVFAGLALLLAMAGVYGVMSCVTAQRTSEIGLRLALGAGPADVFRLVAGRAVLLAAAGMAAGLAISLAAGRVLTSLLFGLRPVDAVTYASVLAAVAAVVLAAAAVPAWRAARIDPVTALREE